MRWMFLILLLFVALNINSQTSYIVDVDDRNMALELMDEAQQFLDENKCKEALKALMESLSVDSVLKETYLLIYKVWLTDKSCREIVLDALKKGKQIFSDDDELCFYMAEILRYGSDYPEAILEYTNAANYAKRNGEDFYLVHYYYFNRANCFMQLKMYDGALVDYDYTLKLNPEFSAAYFNRGVCLYKKGKKEDACLDWKKALDMGYNVSKEYIDKYCEK